MAKKRKRTEEEGIEYWVGPADAVVVNKRGLQENQIEEAREAVKNGADIEQEAWKLAKLDIEAREMEKEIKGKRKNSER